jgi:hypothetical protein
VSKSGFSDFDITSAVTIIFKVKKSWLSEKGIGAVTLYRLVGLNWTALSTTKAAEDAVYAEYTAISPGLSLFAVSGGPAPPSCPACPAEQRGECIAGADGAGSQSVISYACSPATNYACASSTSAGGCCPACPGEILGECVNSTRARTRYSCSADTGYRCTEATVTEECMIYLPQEGQPAAQFIRPVSEIGSVPLEAAAIAALAIIAGALGFVYFRSKKRHRGMFQPQRSFHAPRWLVSAPRISAPKFSVPRVSLPKPRLSLPKPQKRADRKTEEVRGTVCSACSSPTLGHECIICGKHFCSQHIRLHDGVFWCRKDYPRRVRK